jgi:class 3 adenylate cyclase/tetratricopeptide (TPR) repeat protein
MPVRRERKVVTVLFADLAGFTSRAESMDPEDVAALLDPYHARLKSELERYGGTVEKFIGDAVMAIFGAPAAHEDDAERAVRAALAIRDWAEQESIELRVGINTGEALVTLGARPEQGQAMAAGDVVNTAARLQAAAPLGGVLVGEQTFRATERAIEYAEAEPVEAKGKSSPVPVWRAVGARARVSVERVQGVPLVGRRREVDLLVGAFERARQERSPELVTVMGVPGIGKSRLVLELFDWVEEQPELIYWRHGRCPPYGDGVTFWALGEMVKAQAGILEGDGEEEAGRKLRAAVADPWIESHLRALVGLPGAAEGSADRRDEAFTAWRQFFEGLADHNALVLVFEDVHWADENLLDFLDHLVDWASGVPMLVVCTARPELLTRRPSWGGGKPNALTISLTALSDEDTARLLGELLERSVLAADTQAELLARAGGNPLYAEEYARMLRERGRIERLPESVQGLIAARLDLLEPEQKSLVQDASVVGKTFWLGALERLTGDDRSSIERQLHSLERAEFVRRERSASIAGEVEYSFRHLLVRDVAYGEIPRAERAERHRLAADWIGGLGRPEDHSEMVAYHYLQALELGEAAGLDTQSFADAAQTALADAGDRAFGLNAFDAATRHYRAALALLPEGDPRRGELLYRLGQTGFVVGDPDLSSLEQAVEELLATGNLERAADAERVISEQLWLAGDRDAAFDHLDRALALLDDAPASRAKAYTVGHASRFRMLAADYDEAIRLGREALAMAEELGLDELRAAVLNNVGSSRASIGEEKEGLAEIQQAIDVAGGVNSSFEFTRAKGNLASQLWMRGFLADGARLWEEALEHSERYGQIGFARWFRGIEVDKFYALGQWDEALARAEFFIAEVDAGSPHYLSPQAYISRALIGLARGDDTTVRDDAVQALAGARRAKDPQIVYLTLAGAAHVHGALGDSKAAYELADEFLAAITAGREIGFSVAWLHVLSWSLADAGRGPELAAALPEDDELPWVRAALAYARGDPMVAADICGEMGAVTEEAYARLAAARMLSEEGRRAEADEQLRRALAFYRSVGATRYLREGEALLATSA